MPPTPSFAELDIIDLDQEHMLGRIHSMESSSAVDGPGLRFVIFMQGCQFKCKYCHNRDSWDMNAGELFAVSELVEQVMPYATFLDASGGGVTVSGGEAILQPEFIAMLFRKLKVLGLHTCLDTNGNAARQLYGEMLDTLLENVDLVLLDLKQVNNEKHEELIGVPNTNTLNFARHLHEIDHPVWIRHVLVPGHTDAEKDLRSLAEFIAPMTNVERVELLPYHRLGINKWEELGIQYPLTNVRTPSESDMNKIEKLFAEDYGIRLTR